MSLARRAVLRAVPAALAPAAARFRWALRHPERTQEALRRQVAREAARTAYGQHHGVRGEADFDRLPVAAWSDLEPWLQRQRREEGPVICARPVRVYEPTSGSSGAPKLVPYTDRLRRGFAEMFAVWAYDLLRHGPRLNTGRLYLSVSPSLGAPRVSEAGVPIGLEDDLAYLDGWLSSVVRRFQVGPDTPRHETATAFMDAVSMRLLAEPALEVFSVWSPSFLEVLLDHMARHRVRLAAHLPAARRSLVCAGAAPDWRQIWPQLALVSCWDQGPARGPARRLAQRLPGVLLQGKGLLATEAAVTVPWLRAGGCVPLVQSSVVELLDASGTLRAVTDAVVGERYEVVVSPLGGLPRYRLGDRVEATHTWRRVPCLRFVGRAGGVSDLVGEKLGRAFVGEVLDRVVGGAGLQMLLPVEGPPAGYVLLTDTPLGAGAVDRVDAALCASHHYGLARALGQLAPLRTVSSPHAARWVADEGARRGVAWGDQKPAALSLHPVDAPLEALLS